MRRLFSTFKTKPQVVFILGGPCSGKGTQSALIEQNLGYKHLSAGELLRTERKNANSEHGELIQKTINDGKIVPSHITVALLQTAMKMSSQNKFLIDGFPRNLQNLQSWDRAMQESVFTPFIIFLTCSQSKMIERLQTRAANSNRSDDNLETIKKRFRTFHEETVPVVKIFEEQKKVVEVCGEKSVGEIFDEIRDKIEQFRK